MQRTHRYTALGIVVAIAAGCDGRGPTEAIDTGPVASRAASIIDVQFVVSPTAAPQFDAIRTPDSRVHLKNVRLRGSVTGDIEGDLVTVVDITFDATRTGRGHGTVTLTTADGDWEGTTVMDFVGVWTDPPGAYVPLGSLTVQLAGPDGQRLRASCQERLPATSETLDCNGTILMP